MPRIDLFLDKVPSDDDIEIGISELLGFDTDEIWLSSKGSGYAMVPEGTHLIVETANLNGGEFPFELDILTPEKNILEEESSAEFAVRVARQLTCRVLVSDGSDDAYTYWLATPEAPTRRVSIRFKDVANQVLDEIYVDEYIE
jgi:hypothetical protein